MKNRDWRGISLSRLVTLGTVALVFPLGAALAGQSMDFLSLSVGDFAGAPGWTVESGRAEIQAAVAESGMGKSLRLKAGSPECCVAVAAPGGGVSGVAFTVRGLVAAPSADAMEFVNADGALLALVVDAPGRGRFWALDGAGSTPAWTRTEVTLALDAKGALAAPARVRLASADAAGRWTFAVGDAGAGATFSRLKDEACDGAHRFYGFAAADWSLADYEAVSEGAPAGGPSAGGAPGAPPAVTSSAPVAPATPDVPAAAPVAAPAAKLAAALPPALAELPRVYVNAVTGEDRYDGRHPARAKATLLAACESLPEGRGVVVVSAGKYRPVLRRFPAAVFVFNGRVVVR